MLRGLRSGAGIFYSVLLAQLLSSGCGKISDEMSDETPKQYLEGYTLTETGNGERQWRLEGETAVYIEDDSMVLLSGVYLTLFEIDAPSTILQGDSGEIFEVSGTMRIWGNVEVETTDNRHLSTSELLWDADEETFSSDCTVVLTLTDSLGQTVISGVGVVLDQSLGPSEEGIDILESFRAVYSGEFPDV